MYYIKGVPGRGEEVLALLKNKGGLDELNLLQGEDEATIYFIGKDNEIYATPCLSNTAYLVTTYMTELTLPEKKIEPFESMAEFCKAWDGEPLTYKDNGMGKCDVMEISKNGVLLSPGGFFHWYHLAEKFTFSDGTPCGKEVTPC